MRETLIALVGWLLVIATLGTFVWLLAELTRVGVRENHVLSAVSWFLGTIATTVMFFERVNR